MGLPRPLLTLAFNLAPAVSVWLFGWSAFALILLYWTENLVIGAINVLKIAISGFAQGKKGIWPALSLSGFFAFHYGIFLVIHAVIAWTLFGDRSEDFTLAALPALMWTTIRSDPFLFWNALLLAILQIGDFVFGWLGTGAWRTTEPSTQIFEPYGRVAVVHLTIILAAVPVAYFGKPLIAVVCLALLKTGLETGVARFYEGSGEQGSPGWLRKFVER